ncbi:MAG TPA: O-antigen ligase family protein [Gaiellaceae bacterium]|nr:O-antigen ligase family protein [Gaiellaceae bacterium]
MTIRPVRFFFLATVFCATFEKLSWNVAGNIEISDIFALGFIGCFLLVELQRRDRVFVKTSAIGLCFLLLFLLVYLAGYFSLESGQAVQQFWKGLIKFGIHFTFLVLGVIYLSRRTPGFYLRTIGFFTAGMVLNAAYGLLQLLVARSGTNLDNLFINKITGGSYAINVYGIFEQTGNIYRPNALTGDPNHLGIMLILPLLILTPVYLSLQKGHPWRNKLGLTLAFLLVVEILTLSRSGIGGLILGIVLLALPYWRRFVSRQVLIPVGVVAVGFVALIASSPAYFLKVIGSRFQTGGNSTSAHFSVYDFIPSILHSHPAFGLGLNNFAVYYQEVTGQANWGPHSYYVALIVETGLVGTVLFAGFLLYIFARAAFARRLGNMLTSLGDPAGARVTPLAWGMTAGLVGTLFANIFYLTMSFYYFYVFVTLILALPIVFGGRLEPATAERPAPRPQPAPAPA